MLSFNVNNNNKLTVSQSVHDGNVIVTHGNGNTEIITAGDFVMLLNLYTYIKDNDIQNDFINPYGKNKESI